MPLQFAKMHGLGNDFMVIDAINQTVDLTPEHVIQWADRHRGIGFDQCLLIERSLSPSIHFYYRIFNANGHEVGQCVNGARCLAYFVTHYGLTDQKKIVVATKTTQMQLYINSDNTVTVDMGLPQWQPQKIPLSYDHEMLSYPLTLPHGETYGVHALSVGNPHAVMVLENIDSISIDGLGQMISQHPLFPEHTNVGFMQIIDSHTIKLRVYERDCGETMACGSGAVAAFAVGHRFYDLHDHVTIHLPGGELTLQAPSRDQGILLTGPVALIYEGVLLCAL